MGAVGIEPASYDRPKNATRRRATTPRISKLANGTLAILLTSEASSSLVTKSR